jgi:hypothetical protein
MALAFHVELGAHPRVRPCAGCPCRNLSQNTKRSCRSPWVSIGWWRSPDGVLVARRRAVGGSPPLPSGQPGPRLPSSPTSIHVIAQAQTLMAWHPSASLRSLGAPGHLCSGRDDELRLEDGTSCPLDPGCDIKGRLRSSALVRPAPALMPPRRPPSGLRPAAERRSHRQPEVPGADPERSRHQP